MHPEPTERGPAGNRDLPYGGFVLRLFDHDKKGAPPAVYDSKLRDVIFPCDRPINAQVATSPGTADAAQICNVQDGDTQVIAKLQRDLWTLGFWIFPRTTKDGVVGPVVTGVFDWRTEWSVREFQIAAAMPNVAIQDVRKRPTVDECKSPGKYLSTLSGKKNDKIFPEHPSGVVTPKTAEWIKYWLTKHYRCPVVIQACEARGWAYISVAKKNRNFFPQGHDRDKHKLSRYGRNVLRRDGHTVKVCGKRHRVAERVGRLSKAGEVKLVFSRRAGDRAWVVLVTNRRKWSAKTVVSHYQQRWGIEVLFKMAKQHLGLGDYQFLRYRAIENYLRLVLLAYLLLTHQALRASDVQAELKKRHHVLRLASILQLQQRLRATVWDDLVQRLENRPKQRVVARKIKELLQNCG